MSFKFPNIRKGCSRQRGSKCVDLQREAQLIKTQQKTALEKMTSTERSPFSKVPKAITTCTLPFAISVNMNRKEMHEQKLAE